MSVDSKDTYNARIEFRVSDEEKTQIEAMAKLHGMKTSQFIRKIALGYEPFSLVEFKKMEQLMGMNSDLARLGNLIKYWLVNDSKLQVATRMKIENKLPEILDGIHEQKLSIRDLVSEMRKDLVNSRKRW